MFLYSKTALLFSKYILTNVESSSKILPNSSNALLGTFTKISTVSSSFEVFFANLKLSVAVISKVPFWALKFKLVNTILVSEVAHANDVWCADSSAGPYLYSKDGKQRLWIIAFIDDASRLITGCKIFDSDNTVNLMSTLKSAISLNGKPKVLNMDNGKNYRSRQMAIIAAKLGVSLHYDPVKTPQSKAKIERFFRTLKEHWLASINYHDFKSIDDYQISLNNYVSLYNNTIHTSLNGKTPIERRDIDASLIKYIDKDKLDKDFLFEIERKVSFDSIVLIDTREYQVPPKFARKRVKIKYSFDFKTVLIVDENENAYEIRLNNKVDNSITRRTRLTEDTLWI